MCEAGAKHETILPAHTHTIGIPKESTLESPEGRVQRGELPMRKLGKRSLILVSDLTAWIDHLPLVAPLSAAA